MPRCAHLRYIVERLPQRETDPWTVEFCGEHVGRFHRRAEALQSAFFDAKRVGNMGNETEVWARRSDGTVDGTWHYDRERCRMERDPPQEAAR